MTSQQIVFLLFGHVLIFRRNNFNLLDSKLPFISKQNKRIFVNFVKNQNSDTVSHQTFQNIGFSVRIEAKNDPLNIPLFRFGIWENFVTKVTL